MRRSAYVRLWVLLPGVAAWLVTGCSRPIDQPPLVSVEHAVSPDPPTVGPATVIIKLADNAARPVSGASIILEADMSHAGMAPEFEEASETRPGQYESRLRFAMAGDWVIILHLQLPGGQKLERQFNVSGVRPN